MTMVSRMMSSPAAARTNRRRPYVEHEEEAQFCVLVLVSVRNITAVRKQKFAMVATSPLAIGGMQQQDCAFVRESLLCGVQVDRMSGDKRGAERYGVDSQRAC
jgi:hypothetical protein